MMWRIPLAWARQKFQGLPLRVGWAASWTPFSLSPVQVAASWAAWCDEANLRGKKEECLPSWELDQSASNPLHFPHLHQQGSCLQATEWNLSNLGRRHITGGLSVKASRMRTRLLLSPIAQSDAGARWCTLLRHYYHREPDLAPSAATIHLEMVSPPPCFLKGPPDGSLGGADG